MTVLGINMWCNFGRRNILLGLSWKERFIHAYKERKMRWSFFHWPLLGLGVVLGTAAVTLPLAFGWCQFMGEGKAKKREIGKLEAALLNVVILNAHMGWVVFSVTWSRNLANWCRRWGGKISELSLGTLITSGQSLPSTKVSPTGIQTTWCGLLSCLLPWDSYWNNWMFVVPHHNVSFQAFSSNLKVGSSSWCVNDLEPRELLVLHSTDPCLSYSVSLPWKLGGKYTMKIVLGQKQWKVKISKGDSLPPLCLHRLDHSLSLIFNFFQVLKLFLLIPNDQHHFSCQKRSCNILD